MRGLEQLLRSGLDAKVNVVEQCMQVETSDDLDDVVQDKLERWRAAAAKAHRRQCRYIKTNDG